MTWSQENCLIDNHQGEHLLLRPASDGNGDFMAVAMRSGHVKRVRIPYLECVFFCFPALQSSNYLGVFLAMCSRIIVFVIYRHALMGHL